MPRHATSDTRAAQARKPSEVAYLCWDGARDAVLGDIPVTPFFLLVWIVHIDWHKPFDTGPGLSPKKMHA